MHFFQDRSTGVVLVNPVGLKVHRGIRPTWQISFAVWLYDSLTIFRSIFHYIFYASMLFIKMSCVDVMLIPVFP